MTPLYIRRVKMDDYANRTDIMWVLFRAGDICNPLALLTDIEVVDLVASIEQQQRINEKVLV